MKDIKLTVLSDFTGVFDLYEDAVFTTSVTEKEITEARERLELDSYQLQLVKDIMLLTLATRAFGAKGKKRQELLKAVCMEILCRGGKCEEDVHVFLYVIPANVAWKVVPASKFANEFEALQMFRAERDFDMMIDYEGL